MATQEEINGIIPWALAGIGAIVSALLTGVVSLFRLRESENAKQITEHKQKIEHLEIKSDKCEEDRNKLFTQCELHTFEIKQLKEKISRIDIDGTKYSHDMDKRNGS